jgi:hypothetical protein
VTYAENPIQHVAIDPGDLEEFERVLIRGNTVLRRYSDMFRDAYWLLVKHNQMSFGGKRSTFGVLREFKQRLFLPTNHRDSINHVNLKISHEDMAKMEILRSFPLPRRLPVVKGKSTLSYGFIRAKFDCLRSAMSPEDVAKVDAVAAIEWTMIQGFSRLNSKLVARLSNRCTTIVDQAELYQVGYCALIDAIWSYSEPIKFITHAFNCMFRRMKRTLNANSDSGSAATGGNEKLLGAYYQALLFDPDFPELDHFDQVIERVRYREKIGENAVFRSLTDIEVEKLRAVFKSFHRYQSASNTNESDQETDPRDIADHFEGIDFKGMEFREIIRKAGLNPNERELIDLALIGEHGFRTHWAATHNDPNTGKPYSRMTGVNTYNSAIAKILKVGRL